MGSLPAAKAGVGSAMNDTTRQVGGALGVAVLGSVPVVRLRVAPRDRSAHRSLTRPGTASARRMRIADQLPDAGGAALSDAARTAFLHGMGLASLVAAGVAAAGAVVALLWLPARAPAPAVEVIELPQPGAAARGGRPHARRAHPHRRVTARPPTPQEDPMTTTARTSLTGTYLLDPAAPGSASSPARRGGQGPRHVRRPSPAAIHLDFADPGRSSAEVTVEVDSLTTGNARRDEHLRRHFFDAAATPRITFRSTAVDPLADDRSRVTGELTIKGRTRPVSIDVVRTGTTIDPDGTQPGPAARPGDPRPHGTGA